MVKIPATSPNHRYYVALTETVAYSEHGSPQEAEKSLSLMRQREPDRKALGILELIQDRRRWVLRLDTEVVCQTSGSFPLTVGKTYAVHDRRTTSVRITDDVGDTYWLPNAMFAVPEGK